MSDWRDISTVPDSAVIPVLVWVPRTNRGLDSAEVAIVCHEIDGTLCFYTNGGPNGGSDLYFEDEPTHWMPLPEGPQK